MAIMLRSLEFKVFRSKFARSVVFLLHNDKSLKCYVVAWGLYSKTVYDSDCYYVSIS
jgi:hypothetical protein